MEVPFIIELLFEPPLWFLRGSIELVPLHKEVWLLLYVFTITLLIVSPMLNKIAAIVGMSVSWANRKNRFRLGLAFTIIISVLIIAGEEFAKLLLLVILLLTVLMDYTMTIFQRARVVYAKVLSFKITSIGVLLVLLVGGITELPPMISGLEAVSFTLLGLPLFAMHVSVLVITMVRLFNIYEMEDQPSREKIHWTDYISLSTMALYSVCGIMYMIMYIVYAG